MSGISTTATATYTAQTLRGTAKVDKVARADAEVSDICTADWANDVDADLEEVNSVMRGAAGAYVWLSYSFAFTRAASAKVFVPFSGTIEATATTVEGTYIVAPADGQIVRVSIASRATTAGVTQVSFHKGGAGTTPSSNAATEEPATVNVAAVDTAYHSDFTATSVFSKGDLLAIGIDPTGDFDDIEGTLLLKLDTNTL